MYKNNKIITNIVHWRNQDRVVHYLKLVITNKIKFKQHKFFYIQIGNLLVIQQNLPFKNNIITKNKYKALIN